MYQKTVSKEFLLSEFRKAAKELVKVHGKDIGADADVTIRKQHQIFFEDELQELVGSIMNRANHFSDMLRLQLKRELISSQENYIKYFAATYSVQEVAV